MKTVEIVYNPISGRGKGEPLAHALAHRLERDGVTVSVSQSKLAYTETDRERISNRDALLVIGGDGTLRALLEILSQTKTPVYMVPSGNESLFARAFSMSANVERIVQALEEYQVSEHWIGRVNNQPFFTMVSLGLDSQVIERIARARSGPIGHRGYILPTLIVASSHRPPCLKVTVDGREELGGEQGLLVIANSREYAARLNPVPEASTLSGELHARFFPFARVSWYFNCILALCRGKGMGQKDSLLLKGKNFYVEVSNVVPFPVQADGEFMGHAPVTVSIGAERIAVLN